MAGVTDRYQYYPQGSGVYYPIRQTGLRDPTGLLPRGVASKLWSKQNIAQDPFFTSIKGKAVYDSVVPSYFSQIGRGRSDPLQLGRKKRTTRRKKKLF